MKRLCWPSNFATTLRIASTKHPSGVHHVYIWDCDFGHSGFVTGVIKSQPSYNIWFLSQWKTLFLSYESSNVVSGFHRSQVLPSEFHMKRLYYWHGNFATTLRSASTRPPSDVHHAYIGIVSSDIRGLCDGRKSISTLPTTFEISPRWKTLSWLIRSPQNIPSFYLICPRTRSHSLASFHASERSGPGYYMRADICAPPSTRVRHPITQTTLSFVVGSPHTWATYLQA